MLTAFLHISIYFSKRVKISLTNRVPVRWTVAATSANTGGYNYFCLRQKCKRISSGSRFGTNRPVAVPEKIFGLTLFLDFFDRCHSLPSLLPPPAAVGSLPSRSRFGTNLQRFFCRTLGISLFLFPAEIRKMKCKAPVEPCLPPAYAAATPYAFPFGQRKPRYNNCA